MSHVVEELRQRLAEAAERYRKDPRSIIKQQIRDVIPHGIPFWTPPALRELLQSWGLVPQAGAQARALGVVIWKQSTILVSISVSIEHNDSMEEAPLPACLSIGSAVSLREAAHVAISHYPHARSLDIPRQLRFRLLDLSGEELELPEKIEGRSLGLGAAVATWSVLAQAPVPPDLVFTGAVEAGDARVGRVEYVATKRRDVVAAGARLVFPTANVAEVEPAPQSSAVGRVADALDQAFGRDRMLPHVCHPPPAQDVLADLEWLDLRYKRNMDPTRFPEFAERFELFVRSSALPSARRPFAAARAAACWTHCDSLGPAGLERLRQAVQQLDPNEVTGADEVTARTHLAMAYRDIYLFEDARAQAEEAWGLGQRLRIHNEKMKARSTLGQILVAMGRSEEGLPHVRAALEHFERFNSPECPRNHCYLIEALGRAGYFAEAEQEYEQGLHHCEARVEESGRRHQRAYLDYARLNVQLRMVRTTSASPERWKWLHEETIRAMEGLEAAWPRPGLERIRDAAALRVLSRLDEREAVLAQAEERSRTQQRNLLRWHCGMVFLEAALAELARGGELQRIRKWLRTGLRAVPNRRAWRALRPGRGLRADSPTSLHRAILSIVEAEQY